MLVWFGLVWFGLVAFDREEEKRNKNMQMGSIRCHFLLHFAFCATATSSCVCYAFFTVEMVLLLTFQQPFFLSQQEYTVALPVVTGSFVPEEVKGLLTVNLVGQQMAGSLFSFVLRVRPSTQAKQRSQQRRLEG